MARLEWVVVEGGFGVGEEEAEGRSRLGREEEVGVMIAELARRGKGADGSRGEAIVDMVFGWNVVLCVVSDGDCRAGFAFGGMFCPGCWVTVGAVWFGNLKMVVWCCSGVEVGVQLKVELFAGAQVELPSKREPLTSRVPRRARRILGVRVAVVCEPACFILH